MHDFKNLKIWQKAMNVTEKAYVIASEFPKEERFGLTSQVRRSAVSIVSNIAEGAGRNTDGEFKSFLGIANGSTNELFTQLLLSERLKLTTKTKLQPLLKDIIEVQKMNFALIRKLSKKN